MYCVWQVVKTPTIILNNPVFVYRLKTPIILQSKFHQTTKRDLGNEKHWYRCSLREYTKQSSTTGMHSSTPPDLRQLVDVSMQIWFYSTNSCVQVEHKFCIIITLIVYFIRMSCILWGHEVSYTSVLTKFLPDDGAYWTEAYRKLRKIYKDTEWA